MAIQNSIVVIKNLCVVNTAKQGCDAVSGVLGHSMPTALSQQGRPMSPVRQQTRWRRPHPGG